MTQLESAKSGYVTADMKNVAKTEHIDPERLKELVAKGLVVIPINKKHQCRPTGIGKMCSTKVNANIGTSQEHCNPDEEILKLEASVDAGADTIMDLSTGGDIDAIRRELIRRCPVPLGTVPIYQCVVELLAEGKKIRDLDESRIIDTVQRHAESGVDFITIHSGLTKRAVEKMSGKKRIMDVVSRGGSFIVNWIRANGGENPFYTVYDKLIEIALDYDITFSLGDGLRPGCLHDATDELQLDELLVIGELRDRAVDAGVQVMVEGPGHVPLHQVEANVDLEKAVCKGAPFYVLGPLVTDVAPGYDHIAGAIGGAVAAARGADFLCFLTPSEHLRLPTVEDTRAGVIATRIAAHAGDIAKGIPGARDWDDQMSRARHNRDWETMFKLAIDGPLAKSMREAAPTKNRDVCSMCGDLCSIKQSEQSEEKTSSDDESLADPTL